MATSTKKAAPAAKQNAKANSGAPPAPIVEAPPQEEAEGGELQLAIGDSVAFLGYSDEVADEDRILTVGEVYKVTGFTDPEGDDPGGNPIVEIANSNFNAKKKEHATSNPKVIEVEAMFDELELVGAEEPVEDAVVVAPAKGRGKAANTVKAAAETAPKAAAKSASKGKTAPVEAVPAKGRGKGKTAPVEAVPVKSAGKGKGKAVEVPEMVDKDAVPDLVDEDPDVLALVEGAEDLITTAQELEAQAATTEWQIGGLLYHIKKDKAHHEILGEDGKPIGAYQEPGGFDLFLEEYFNIGYRKAMYLIKIYIGFTLSGIENPAERLAQIGWTKAAKIAEHMGAEDSNPEELVELAANNTVPDLSEALKDSVRVGTDTRELVKRLTLRFRFMAADAAAVNAILEKARDTLGLKDLSETLSYIITDWAMEKAGGVATKAAAPPQRATPSRRAAASASAAVN